MSDYIPVEILAEIMKRVPVKSLIRLRSVSKSWKSLIENPEFTSSYHICQTQPQHRIYVQRILDGKQEYMSYMDDHTFPMRMSFLTVPSSLILLGHPSPLSCVSGLLCFCDKRQDLEVETMMVVLWNPAVRKSIGIVVPDVLHSMEGLTFIGFGVCPNTSDPKLVKINAFGFRTKYWDVEVFKLSTRVWKTVSNIPPAFGSCDLTWEGQVCVGGFIYWLAYDDVNLRVGVRSNLIVSFDLKSDEFGEVCLPDRLVHKYDLRVTKVKESLGLFENYDDGHIRFCGVWIMKEEGVTKSFAKMFSVRLESEWPDQIIVLDITKDGKAILVKKKGKYIDHDDMPSCVLSAYDPCSKTANGIGIIGRVTWFAAKSYMETLLLLDQSNSFIY